MNAKVNTIQYLRGFASFYVVLTHLRLIYPNPEESLFYKWTDFGFSGINLFFVISGFIITYTTPETKGFLAYIRYLKKRFIRIYPVYWTVLIPMVLMGLFITAKTYFHEPGVIVKNFLLVHSYQTSILGVSWTLTFEIFFYFIFGLTLLNRYIKLKLILLLWIVLFVAKRFSLDLPLINSLITHYSFLEFILGCLIALSVKNFTLRIPLFFPLLFLCYFIFSPFLFQYFITLPKSWVSNEMLLKFSIPSALVVFTFIFYEKSCSPKTNNFLLLLGDASYSIYLIHLPLIIIIKQIFIHFTFNQYLFECFFLFCLMTIIYAGVLFHKRVELTLIERFKKWLL